MVPFAGELHCSVNHDDFFGGIKGTEQRLRAILHSGRRFQML